MTELSGAGIEELVAKRNELELLVQEENKTWKNEVKKISEMGTKMKKNNDKKSETEEFTLLAP